MSYVTDRSQLNLYCRPEYDDTGFIACVAGIHFQKHAKGTKLQASAKLLREG